jgi:hemerythrin-like domain-containing protein
MYPATTQLRNDHDAILQMLDAIEEQASTIASGTAPKPETLSGVVEFIRVFADRCHHGKEEDLLFPLLESKGMPRGGGPIAVMLMEHDQGRAFVAEMAKFAQDYAAGNAGSGSRWAEAARGYAALLRAHIAKENNILFMMAERILSESEQADLAEQFEEVERVKIGEGTHEKLHALLQQLVEEIFKGKRMAS